MEQGVPLWGGGGGEFQSQGANTEKALSLVPTTWASVNGGTQRRLVPNPKDLKHGVEVWNKIIHC